MHQRNLVEKVLEGVLFKSRWLLEELANEVGVSVSTVRRDLTALEGRSSVRRTHGGARTLQQPKSDEFVFNVRDTHQIAEKDAMGRACAALISPGQNVILDSGTTYKNLHLPNARHSPDGAFGFL